MRAKIAIMLTATILAVSIAVVAVKDHRHTRQRLDRADVFAWYCEHRGLFCDRTKAESIHHGWVMREYWYLVAEGLLALSFVGSGFWLLRSRRLR